MKYQYIPNILPLMISGLITLSLGIFVLIKYRSARISNFFIISMFVVTLWSLPNALELSAIELPEKLFWANIQYFAYCFSPVTLLAISMQFTGYDKWIRSKKALWLTVLPAIIIILVWTDQWHGLIRYDIQLKYNGQFFVISKKYGIVFYVHALYSHIINLSAMLLLGRAVFHKSTVYKKQAIPLLIGTSLIFLPNVFYILGLSPLSYDITPVFFGPAGCIMLWAIFRYRIFGLVPLARASVIESMDAGIIVLDLQERILDVNPAFEQIIGVTSTNIIHHRIDDVCYAIPELVEACKDRCITHAEFKITIQKLLKIYKILLSPLMDKHNKYIGRLVVIYDITSEKQAQQEFMEQQWRLAVGDERERMARDLHDNIGQILGFINFQAQAIRQTLINEGINSVSHKLDQLVEVTQTAHLEVREYISSIRLSVNKERDFLTSLKNIISNFEYQTGISVELVIPDILTGKELKPAQWLNILNIIREGMNNIIKHAQAKRVMILFDLADQRLSVIIADDGKGFSIIQYDNPLKSKFGIDIMRERTAEINGNISFESELGQGSRILLTVPIKEGGKQDADEINVG